MKLPSLQALWQSTNQVFKRFPIEFLLAIVSTLTWWYLIDSDSNNEQLWRVLFVCNFAFTLLVAGDLYCEVNVYAKQKQWAVRVAAIFVSVGLYFSLNPFNSKADLLRMFLIGFALHLLVSFAPFIGKGRLNGFWQYNKSLFLRFLTAAFYAFVLYIGLAIALYAIDGLFNADIGYKAYYSLFAMVSAGFTTIFFLAGIPTDFSALESDYSYPKALKIFTQYVLIPLMTIYLAILLVYEIKIIIIWSLPKGIVSSLILGYAVFGILSLLLIQPIKDKEGNGWMRLFSKFFYLMMIPLVILLVLAIVKRTASYGITESRYILMILAFWLACITVYFLTSKKQNIKIIPVSLFILALASIYGPQSAFSVAKNSQLSRLKHMMERKDKASLKERPAIIRYLVTNHGLSVLQRFTKVNLEEIEAKIDAKSAAKKKMYRYEIVSRKIDTAFSLLKIAQNDFNSVTTNITILNENRGLIAVSGYDAVFSFTGETNLLPWKFDGLTFKFEQTSNDSEKRNKNILKVYIGNDPPFSFNIGNAAKKAYSQFKADNLKEENDLNGYHHGYLYPSVDLQFSHETSRYTITLIVSKMSGNYDDLEKDFEWFDFDGSLLIKKKK